MIEPQMEIEKKQVREPLALDCIPIVCGMSDDALCLNVLIFVVPVVEQSLLTIET